MDKTLRTAIPLLLLVGLALMTPTAAADVEDAVEPSLDRHICRFVELRTFDVRIGTVATVHGQYVCL